MRTQVRASESVPASAYMLARARMCTHARASVLALARTCTSVLELACVEDTRGMLHRMILCGCTWMCVVARVFLCAHVVWVDGVRGEAGWVAGGAGYLPICRLRCQTETQSLTSEASCPLLSDVIIREGDASSLSCRSCSYVNLEHIK